jgi:DNA-binding NtrC family response regulator
MQNARIRGVLVIEQDVELRENLRELLHTAGYASVGVSDLDLAWDVLQLSPQPLVVLVEHGDPRFPAEALVEAASAVSGQAGYVGHAYVLLSTHPEDAPHLRNPSTQHAVPVVEIPSDIDRLTGAVEAAFRRLRRRCA